MVMAVDNMPAPLGIVLAKAEAKDAVTFTPLLREADRAEIVATFGAKLPVEFILRQGIEQSIEAWAMWFNGELACLWGVSVLSVNVHGSRVDFKPERVACGWLLTTRAVDRHPKTFWLACGAIFPQVLERYGMLINWIDVRHVKAIRWADRLGFHLDPPAPHGVDGLPFRRFKVTKECFQCVSPR